MKHQLGHTGSPHGNKMSVQSCQIIWGIMILKRHLCVIRADSVILKMARCAILQFDLNSKSVCAQMYFHHHTSLLNVKLCCMKVCGLCLSSLLIFFNHYWEDVCRAETCEFWRRLSWLSPLVVLRSSSYLPSASEKLSSFPLFRWTLIQKQLITSQDSTTGERSASCSASFVFRPFFFFCPLKQTKCLLNRSAATVLSGPNLDDSTVS